MADLLRTDYKDDILNTDVNTQRKYRIVENGDGTVSFEDVTEYKQVGDNFGAADINKTNLAIDELNNALNYSTSEHIVGKFDGKDVYEKTIVYETEITNGANVIVGNIDNAKDILSIVGAIAINTTKNTWHSLNLYSASTQHARCYVAQNEVHMVNNTAGSIFKLIATIRYTK